MTNSFDKCKCEFLVVRWFVNICSLDKNQAKRKQSDDNILESSIFDYLENEFQIGDMVWAKLNGFSWWPAFVYGCFSDNGKYAKIVSKPGVPIKKQYFIYCFGSHFKYGWVHQAYLHRYEGLEEFINYSDNQIEQATTKRTEEQVRKKFRMQMAEEIHSIWKEAIKEADEILSLPNHLRINTFEKMVHRLLVGTKYLVAQQEKEQIALSDHVSGDILTHEEQQAQMLSSLCNLPKRSVSNKRILVSPEPVEKTRRTFSFNSTRNETEQSSKNPSKSYLMPTMNEFDNDVMIVKLNTPTQTNSVSLTTAICHFLDKGIPSLTLYEEICLVNELINHRKGSLLTLTDAQLYVEQYVIHIASRNFHHEMLFVQSDFFYDFLLKYPQIILKHRQWFTDFKQTLMPIYSDKIQLKKWQLATLLYAHRNLEQHFH